MDPKPLTTADVMRAFRASWWWITLISSVAASAVFGYILVRPAEYRGEVSLQITQPDSSSRLGSLAVLNQSAATPLRTIKGLMDSERAKGPIMSKFGLNWEKFENKFKVVEETQTNQLVVTFDDPDKTKILSVLIFAVEKLREIDRSLSLTLGSRQADALEAAVKKKSAEVKFAEDKLLAFQKRMKAPSDPMDPKSAGSYLEQLRKLEFDLGAVRAKLKQVRTQLNLAAIEAPATITNIPGAREWQKNLQTTQYELRLAKTRFNSEHPEVKRLERAVIVARTEFQNQVQRYIRAVNQNLDPTIADLEATRVVLEFQTANIREIAKLAPQEALTLSRLVAEVTTVRMVAKDLRSQFEQARIDSEVSRVRWNVLDSPYIHRRPTNKQKGIPTVFAFIAVFFGILGVATISHRKRSEK